MNLAQVVNQNTGCPDPARLALLRLTELGCGRTLAQLLRIHLAQIRVHERQPPPRSSWPRESD